MANFSIYLSAGGRQTRQIKKTNIRNEINDTIFRLEKLIRNYYNVFVSYWPNYRLYMANISIYLSVGGRQTRQIKKPTIRNEIDTFFV